MGVAEKTVKNRIDESDCYYIKKGKVCLNEKENTE